MNVSIDWLRELVNLEMPIDELVTLLPLRTIGTKEVTERFIELDMKGYNRADLLSMRGVAYEVAAITNSKVTFTEPSENAYYWIQNELPPLEVKIENPEAVPFYCLVKIDGLKVEQSSSEVQQKLSDSGIRVVNNLADITNLIMVEYGQPLHAFDGSSIVDQKIIVRPALASEKLITLDGKERQLQVPDIVIADSEKAVGLAGVMGGSNSEITDNTTTILLEAAIFDPIQLRKTATRLNLSSEAGKRFYHGLTKKRLLQALQAAIGEYQRLGGRVNGIAIVGDSEEMPRQILLSQKKTVELIGTPISDVEIEKFLGALQFNLLPQADSGGTRSWQVTPPYYRLDIEIEEDVIEEVARLYGYEKIPAQPLSSNMPAKINQSEYEFMANLKSKSAAGGFTEVATYSFYSTAILEALGWNENNKNQLLKLSNPMSAETEYMRQTIWANLAEVAAKNYKQGIKDIAIYEIGKVYRLNEKLEFSEFNSLGLALVGDAETAISELYQRLTGILGELGVTVTVTPGLGALPIELYHPTKQYQLNFGDKNIGGIAEVHPRVMFKLGLEGKRVAVAEITLSAFGGN